MKKSFRTTKQSCFYIKQPFFYANELFCYTKILNNTDFQKNIPPVTIRIFPQFAKYHKHGIVHVI
jgi:hypothetical protein